MRETIIFLSSDTAFGWLMGVGFLPGIVAMCIAHGRFWLRYREVHPNSRVGNSVSLWLFRYVGGSLPLRILHTVQQDPELERRRRWFVPTAVYGQLIGVAIVALLFLRVTALNLP